MRDGRGREVGADGEGYPAGRRGELVYGDSLGMPTIGARSSETERFDVWLVFRLARQPVWLLGVASMILGFVFQLTALHFGALALVQPILALELLFVFGYLAVAGSKRVTVKRRDWLAAAAMSAGIGMFLWLASPSGGGCTRRARCGCCPAWSRSASYSRPWPWPSPCLRSWRVPLPPGRSAGSRHRDLMGFRGRGHQGTQLPPWRRYWRHLLQLVALRARRRRSGDDAPGLACAGGRTARRVAARVHRPGSAIGQPARCVPVRRAYPDRGRGPGRRGARAGYHPGRCVGPQPQLPHPRRGRASVLRARPIPGTGQPSSSANLATSLPEVHAIGSRKTSELHARHGQA